MIVAVSPDRVIGVGNKIPWHYSADLKRFKAVTTGHTVIMGRRTFESIGKALPNRRNIVITSAQIAGVECFGSLAAAVATVQGDAWIIGGAQLYAEGMQIADRIDVTYVPDVVDTRDAVLFPIIDDDVFAGSAATALEGDERLLHRVFVRRS